MALNMVDLGEVELGVVALGVEANGAETYCHMPLWSTTTTSTPTISAVAHRNCT